jgi:hypothetical protein
MKIRVLHYCPFVHSHHRRPLSLDGFGAAIADALPPPGELNPWHFPSSTYPCLTLPFPSLSYRTASEPSKITGAPPPLRNAFAPPTFAPSPPMRYCPVHPPHSPHAWSATTSTPKPSVPRGNPRRRASPARGDRCWSALAPRQGPGPARLLVALGQAEPTRLWAE